MTALITQGPPVQCSVALKDDPREKLLFESFPEDISEGYSTRYIDQLARTSQATYATYNGGNYNPFRLSLKFYAGAHRDINTTLSNMTVGGQGISPSDAMRTDLIREQEIIKMEAKVRWLEALCFPRPNRPRVSSEQTFLLAGVPPRILITFGRFMTIEGQVDDISITWGPPFDPESARPISAKVDITVKRLGTFLVDWYDVSQKATKRSPVGYSIDSALFEEVSLPVAEPFVGPIPFSSE